MWTWQSFTVLKHQNFLLLFLAHVAASLGNAFYFIALPFLVLQEQGSATAVGLTGAASVLPYVLLGPIAGIAADRLNRKHLMVIADLLRSITIALLLFGSFWGDLAIWHFILIAFLLTTADLLFFPARGAILPNIVDKEQLVAANSLMLMASQFYQNCLFSISNNGQLS